MYTGSRESDAGEGGPVLSSRSRESAARAGESPRLLLLLGVLEKPETAAGEPVQVEQAGTMGRGGAPLGPARAFHPLLLLPLLMLMLAAPAALALPKDRLYRHELPTAQRLSPEPNGMVQSAELQLQTPVHFYDREYNSIFVSTGLIPPSQFTCLLTLPTLPLFSI